MEYRFDDIYCESFKFDIKYKPDHTSPIEIINSYGYIRRALDDWIEISSKTLFECGVIDELEDEIERIAKSRLQRMNNGSRILDDHMQSDDTFIVLESTESVLEFSKVEGTENLKSLSREVNKAVEELKVVEFENLDKSHAVAYGNTLTYLNVSKAIREGSL